jgi:hypothetical protein
MARKKSTSIPVRSPLRRKKKEKVKVQVAKRPKVKLEAKPPASCPRCKSLKIEVITVAREVAEFLEPSHKPSSNSRTHVSDSRACMLCGKRWSVAA